MMLLQVIRLRQQKGFFWANGRGNKVSGAYYESGKRAGSGVQGDKGQGLGGAQSTALSSQYFR